MDSKQDLQEAIQAEHLSKAIKKGNYDQLLRKTNKMGQISLQTERGKKIEHAEYVREKAQANRPPVLATSSTKSFEDERHLKLCVAKVVRSYQRLIADGRKYPSMVEMTIRIDVIVPYG